MEDLKSLLVTHHIEIKDIHHLTRPHLKAIDFILSFKESKEKIKTHFLELSNRHSVDMCLMPHDETRKNKRLIVFDMDSTLIQHEVIDEMALVHGIGDKVKLITEKAMNGELNFDEALKERVSLLKGLKRREMENILSHLKLSPGAESLIKNLKNNGYKTAIISGGFKYFADHFKNKLKMDYAFANDLEFREDTLTGVVRGAIINAQEKARLVEMLAAQENLSLEQVVAVGDGANDLPMLSKAGFGIAFHAKEKVRLEAPYQMNHGPMTSILYFLGLEGDHFNETL